MNVGVDEEENARAAVEAVVATKNNANVENLLFLRLLCFLRVVDVVVVATESAREDSVIVWRILHTYYLAVWYCSVCFAATWHLNCGV